MNVEVIETKPQDFLLLKLKYKLGTKEISLHNDDWADIVQALMEYWGQNNE